MPDDTADNNIDSLYAVRTGRKLFFIPNLDEYGRHGVEHSTTPHPTDDPHRANVISSEIAPDEHLPVIDCDFPLRVVRSSTPGHGHLYIDQPLTWQQYQILLDGFYRAGLIQQAWYENALRDQRSFVRLPHVHKPEDDDHNPNEVEVDLNPVFAQLLYP